MTHVQFAAIGHSTNLITPESNIIVVRGGNHGKPVNNQILKAIEDFFPDADMLTSHGIGDELRQTPSGQLNEGGGPLRRVDTGISSIVGPDNGNRPGGFVLVIDGAGLSEALGNDERKALLLKLAMLCEGVICCRVSPLQKALMVKLVKDGIQAMTLAIGDGANDVSMIQASCDTCPTFVTALITVSDRLQMWVSASRERKACKRSTRRIMLLPRSVLP